MPIRVALTDVFPKSLYPVIAAAAPADWTFEVATEATEESRMRMISGADFLFCGGAVTTDEMLRQASRLRFVQKTGAGFNNINVGLCRELGIGLANLAGNNAPTVAEHTVLLMLAVYRHLTELDRRLRAGGWAREETRASHRELRGKVVGLIGLGHIGQNVARRVNAFGTQVIYYDVNRQPPEVEAALAAEYTSLEDLLRRADIVSLHVPIFPETEKLINAERLALMKPDAVLINCARGALVDEPALIAALQAGHLYGAGLDCMASERENGTKPYWDLPNVVLSPHIAGSSVENFTTMMQRCFANARSYLAGDPLPASDVIFMPPVRRQPPME
jgi:phosphoglycerate dehydrogenase-like enzyme